MKIFLPKTVSLFLMKTETASVLQPAVAALTVTGVLILLLCWGRIFHLSLKQVISAAFPLRISLNPHQLCFAQKMVTAAELHCTEIVLKLKRYLQYAPLYTVQYKIQALCCMCRGCCRCGRYSASVHFLCPNVTLISMPLHLKTEKQDTFHSILLFFYSSSVVFSIIYFGLCLTSE